MMGARPETTFAAISGRLLREPNTEAGVAFHQPTLKAHGKIFAVLVREKLVVKLLADLVLTDQSVWK